MAKKAFIGPLADAEKLELIKPSSKVIVFGEPLGGYEHYTFKDVIMYKYYFDLLQRISGEYTLVFNEFLNTDNRYALNYNCARKYVLQTENVILFQSMPLMEKLKTAHDLLSLNPFMKEPLDGMSFENFDTVGDTSIELRIEHIELTPEELQRYEAEKHKIAESVNKDPDIIPRRLLKWSEGQNEKRFKGLDTKRELKFKMHIGVNNTKVDQFYFNHLQEQKKEWKNVIQAISKH